MKNNIAKCGCDCKNCPTYKENIITDEDRLNCSKGWNKYLNIKLSPEKIRKCNGCSIPNNERKVYYLNCKVRKCAMVNEIKNCAYCTGFPCYELLEAHSLQKIQSAEEFISTSGKEISEEDFNLYIEPYLGLKHLNDIRQTLLKKEIIDFKKFLVKNKFASFSASKDYPKELEIIYNLLKNICNENNISYSKLQTLQHKRKQLLKLLWIFILYGDYNNNSKILSISSKSFLKHKITAMYETLIMYFNDLKKNNIFCEIIPLQKTNWLTPRGGLRKDGWQIDVAFGGLLKKPKTIKNFKDYLVRLEKKYGKNAFRYFNNADLRIMMN